MRQKIVIVDDLSERASLMAQALRKNGYGVITLRARNNEELRESLRRLRPDFLVVGDEVVIDLKARGDEYMPQEIGIAC